MTLKKKTFQQRKQFRFKRLGQTGQRDGVARLRCNADSGVSRSSSSSRSQGVGLRAHGSSQANAEQ